jgi:hypothetical protein
MAEACKRLIKNCIICWNYLYLSQTLIQIEGTVKREEFLKAMAHGSAATWEHVNLLGDTIYRRKTSETRSESSPQN